MIKRQGPTWILVSKVDLVVDSGMAKENSKVAACLYDTSIATPESLRIRGIKSGLRSTITLV